MSGAVATVAPGADVEDGPPGGGKVDLWICWWTTVGFYLLFGVIFVPLTHVMPPPGPGRSVADTTAFFHHHTVTIQIGFALLLLVMGACSISNGFIAYQMTRMSVSKVYAYGYIATLAVGALPGCMFAAFMFLTAVFRPDTDPQILSLLNDATFLTFVGSLGCFAANYAVLAIAVLLDENEIFPRWFAYMAIWQVVTELLAAPVFIFKKGPFAWNGVISFWEATGVFGIFLVFLIALLRTSVQRHPAGSRTGT